MVPLGGSPPGQQPVYGIVRIYKNNKKLVDRITEVEDEENFGDLFDRTMSTTSQESVQVLVFNSTATILYLVAAIVEASLVGHGVKGRHNYNSWAASTFFAFLVSLCYAGSSFLGFRAWRDRRTA